jgi:hypothetical protein
MPWTAAAIAGSAVIGAGASLYGGSQAAGASGKAADLQMKTAIANANRLGWYDETGKRVLQNMQDLAQAGPNGGGPDYLAQAAALGGPNAQLALEATPGYQFTRQQGLQATQSAAAARGLGVSGAALKGAAKFATGLADQTYQSRFSNLLNLNTGQQGNVQNQFNRLYQVSALGENAAAGTGTQATTAAGNAGNYLNQAGVAQAAGGAGVGSALNQGAQNYLGYNYLQNLIKRNPGTGGYNNNGWDSGFGSGE